MKPAEASKACLFVDVYAWERWGSGASGTVNIIIRQWLHRLYFIVMQKIAGGVLFKAQGEGWGYEGISDNHCRSWCVPGENPKNWPSLQGSCSDCGWEVRIMTVWDEPCFWLFTPLPLHLSTSPCWSPSLRPLPKLHCSCVLNAIFRQQLVIGLKHSFPTRQWATLEVSRRKPSPRCCVGNIFTATIHDLCLHLTQRPRPSDVFVCWHKAFVFL